MIDLYHDRARRLLVYRTPEPDRVVHYVPEACRLNGSCVALPATLHNVQLLRVLQYPVVGIMEASGYDWPIERGRKPLAHQKLMAEFMVSHPRCFNLSDMGTMKTIAALWAADFVMQQENCRALIVAPLSICSTKWAGELFSNFLGRRTCALMLGSREARSKALNQPADFYIINFDGVGVGANIRKRFELDGFAKELHGRTDIRIAVVDEARHYSDATTRRNRISRLVFGDRDYLWQLTGTPTPNGPADAYGMAKLAGTTKGESFGSFHNRTMMKVGMWKWVPRAGAYDEARKLLQPAIRFDIKDVWDGPDMTTQQREVALTDEQKKAFAGLKRDLQVVVRSGQPITAVNEAAARQKFLQISLGAVYDQDHKVHYLDASPRINELRQVIANTNASILCFAGLTSVVNLLYRELKQEIGCAIVNGETPQRERADIFERFQRPESDLRLLIADPGCMAHGLDLWRAQTVVWFGPVDRTELYLQANRRAHRPGQKYPVTIVQLVSTPLEREIFKRLETNESLQGLLLQMVREGKL
jgi:SNF2 family DNA or RNA helicase